MKYLFGRSWGGGEIEEPDSVDYRKDYNNWVDYGK